ncbi:MAG: GNAT family N-acetyltransferase [Caulobacter sp.]|nr:GNAT family N-acetyltransferase [Caulobacter sp.]
MDRWFHEKAHTHHDKHHCRVTTIHAPGDEVPVAFYALAIVAERLIDKKSLIPSFLLGGSGHFPSLRLEWAAVRHDLQGKGLGTIVMGRVLTVFSDMVAETGMPALTLKPLNDRAATFYRRLGFIAFGPNVLGRRMMLPAEKVIEI